MSDWNSKSLQQIETESQFNKWVERPREYYKALKDPKVVSIEECVKDALKTGNHALFAKMFINRSEWKSEERFPQWVSEVAEPCGINIHNIDFVSTRDWRDPAISPDEMTYVSQPTKSGWIAQNKDRLSNPKFIHRDNLIQLELALNLDADTANAFLTDMGERGLYPLDIVDAIETFYLNYFHDKKIGYTDKLKTVKEEINRALIQLSGEKLRWIDRSKGQDSSENIKSKGSVRKPLFSILHDSRLGSDIEEELASLKDTYEKSFDITSLEIPKNHTLTLFMTKYFQKRLSDAKDVRSYYESGEFMPYSVFTERQYGYLKRTMDYLYDWESYEKNLMESGWTLDGNVCYKDEAESRKKAINTSTKRVMDKILKCAWEYETAKENRSKDSSTKQIISELREQYYKACMDAVHYIETQDCVIEELTDRKVRAAKKSVTRNYIEGIPVRGKAIVWKNDEHQESIADYAPEDSGDGEVSGYMVQELNNKKNIMQYGIATGHEEDLGNYLCLAGYWKKNWYMELVNGYIRSEGAEDFLPDRLDALYLYAMEYRDAVIKQCGSSKEGILDESVKETLRRDFPMRELLTIISRDISFAYTVCETSIQSAVVDWETRKSAQHDKRGDNAERRKGLQYYEEAEKVYERMRKNMLFPIEWTTSREKPYSLDRESNPLYERKECEKL